MKTLILSTLAAAALALSAGTALADDNGFEVYLNSSHKAPVARSFLAGEAVYAPTTAPVNFQTDRNGSNH